MTEEAEHVHVLIAYPPKLFIRVLVNNLNTNLRKASNSGVIWSRSYFAWSAGSATIETLKACVTSNFHTCQLEKNLNY